MINICLIGHGMMGVWHSEALRGHAKVNLHSVVGKEQKPVEQFAKEYGFSYAMTNMLEAIRQPEIDAVIIAGPSETHAAMAMHVIKAKKHLLVEIPLGMTLLAAEEVVMAAEKEGLILAVSHPMRFRPERQALLARIKDDQEKPRHIQGRFFIHRLVNIGATGLKRAWIDNLLWHHTTHLLDFGLWLVGGGDPAVAERKIRRIQSFMSKIDHHTGTPMEVVVLIETEDDQTIMSSGSYYSTERIYDTFVVTDQNSYRLDELTARITTGTMTEGAISEHENAFAVARDFVDAVGNKRPPLVTGQSVLPVLRILQKVQAEWDAKYEARNIPGRPLDQLSQPVT